jgi:zinc protease
VIGHLDEITAFTAPQCMQFYDKYYSPNNAFVVITGDVKHDEIFSLAKKYFGTITKQLPAAVAGNSPDVMNTHPKITDMDLNYPLQDYCYTFAQPAASDKDYFAYDMLVSLLFTDENSILNERLEKREHSIYAIVQANESISLYPSRTQFDVFMPPAPGNVKVKRAIREEMDNVIANGIPQEKVNDFLSAMEADLTMGAYSAEEIAGNLGEKEYYFHDYHRIDTELDDYKKVTQEDLKRVAGIYLAADKVDVINIKPAE